MVSRTETRVTSSTGAQKGTKPVRMSLVPVGPLERVAELYDAGSKKYSDHNWRLGYPWSLSYDAALRHLLRWQDGEDYDPELGTHHLTSAVFHMFTLLEFEGTHPEFDDRYKR